MPNGKYGEIDPRSRRSLTAYLLRLYKELPGELERGAEEIIGGLRGGGAFGPGPVALGGMLRRVFLQAFRYDPEVRRRVLEVVRREKLPPGLFEEIKGVYPTGTQEELSAAYRATGFSPGIGGFGGFYDPRAKAIFVKTEASPTWQARTLFEELMHHLQERAGVPFGERSAARLTKAAFPRTPVAAGPAYITDPKKISPREQLEALQETIGMMETLERMRSPAWRKTVKP